MLPGGGPFPLYLIGRDSVVATWKMSSPPTQMVTSKVIFLECPSSCSHRTPFIAASSVLDSPQAPLCAGSASTGSAILRNEAKQGSGCKLRADNVTCAHSLAAPHVTCYTPYLQILFL